MIEMNIPQGSPEWYEIRRGIPTGSAFDRIVTPAKGDYSASADDYAGELIAEALGWDNGFSGTPGSPADPMLHQETLRWLHARRGLVTRPAGFCLSDCGRYGVSPDALTAADEPVEIRRPDLHTFLKWRIRPELPAAVRIKCHAALWVTGAPRCWLVVCSSHADVDHLLLEIPRDAFTEKLGQCVEQFCDRLGELQRQVLGDEAARRLILAPAARRALAARFIHRRPRAGVLGMAAVG